jgi:hypothetical protein
MDWLTLISCPLAKFNPLVYVIVAVEPIAVLEAVTAGKETSDIILGLSPDVSVKNTLHILKADAAGEAWEDVNVIKSIREPLVPAVKRETKVPLPSLAVFAAAILAVTASGIKVKIGCTFAAIIINLKYHQ